MKNRSETSKQSYASGKFAESIAALMLQLKGYRILARRWKASPCEIDILAAKNRTLIVVEVKRRAGEQQAGEALQPRQQKELVAAGNAALSRFGNQADSVRFDVVLLSPGRLPRHIKNAFF